MSSYAIEFLAHQNDRVIELKSCAPRVFDQLPAIRQLSRKKGSCAKAQKGRYVKFGQRAAVGPIRPGGGDARAAL